jgi:hypothetical protein
MFKAQAKSVKTITHTLRVTLNQLKTHKTEQTAIANAASKRMQGALDEVGQADTIVTNLENLLGDVK